MTLNCYRKAVKVELLVCYSRVLSDGTAAYCAENCRRADGAEAHGRHCYRHLRGDGVAGASIQVQVCGHEELRPRGQAFCRSIAPIQYITCMLHTATLYTNECFNMCMFICSDYAGANILQRSI